MANKNLKENKVKRFFGVMFRDIIKFFSPTLYVKLQYKYITHHTLHLDNPIRYTEKLQVLRLLRYPKDPLVSKCASRVGVREYIKELGLEDILIPCLGVYSSFDDINFDELPNQFVMKCSHGMGMNEIVLDKSKIDKEKLRKKFNKWLKLDYGKKTVEPHYSPIKKEIIIEQYIGDLDSLPTEYKFHCFNGVAKNLYVVTGRGKDIRYNNYYIDWTPFDESQFNGWKKTDYPLEKPSLYDKMVKIAEKLSTPFPFVRVDLYQVGNKIYFGEMTFTPAKGTLIFDDDKADFIQGEWLDISNYHPEEKK